ncbi:MAG: XdhC family protein [bacterium]
MTNTFSLYEVLKQALREEKPVAVATVITNDSDRPIDPGSKMLVFPDATVEGGLGDGELEQRVRADALELLAQEKSKTLSYEFESARKIEVYIESILPPPPLVIVGADPDAVPLVTLGKRLGFKVILVDHRANFANREKYPDADATLVVPAEEIAQNLEIDEKTFVLVKTHNYLKDKEILKFVLKSKARYVGQLGPKARMEDLLRDLKAEGVTFSERELEKLYAPVGLDIGAESPEQIALSILAEMLAVKNGRRGGSLRDQTLAIHPRD